MRALPSISNNDFFVYLRQCLVAADGALTRGQAEHLDVLCMLVRSKQDWMRGIGSTRIVEVQLLLHMLLAGYDAATMTTLIWSAQANVIPIAEPAEAVEHAVAEWKSRDDVPRSVRLAGLDAPAKASLRLVAINRRLVEDPDFMAARADTPIETLIVRDDLGRKLEVAGLMLGKVAFSLEGLGVVGEPDGHAWSDDTIVSKAPLDAAKTYLVVVVEHPDEIEAER